MGRTLEQFAADCHNILKAEPGPDGTLETSSKLVDRIPPDRGFTSCRTCHVQAGHLYSP